MVFEIIRVLVCGAGFHQVEVAIGGFVENINYAWNRRYEVSCTSVPGVDQADTRLLSMCHLVVLTKGANPPLAVSSYQNKPVVSVEGAPESVVRVLRDGCDFYYGEYAMENLPAAVVDIGLSPRHVIWDDGHRCLTPTGELALRRAFWLMDRDNDGVLNLDELLVWQRSVTSASFSKNDLAKLLAGNDHHHLSSTVVNYEYFVNMQRGYLLDGDARRVWATLHVSGLQPDGLPYSWRDIHMMRVCKESNTYLSLTAIQFFRNLYKLRLFPNPDDMWNVTPGCPWEHINGFLKTQIPLDRFIEYWKYMALVKREVVVQYARYWGYKGETSFLFLLRHARPYREIGEAVPNTIQVLVIGATGCGRRSLIFTLTTTDDELFDEKIPLEDTFVRTTTFFVRNGLEEVPQTVVYVTVPINRAKEVLQNETSEKQIDIVLLCYDGMHAAETTPSIMRVYKEAKTWEYRCQNLPFVVVMTKAECTSPGDISLESNLLMERFCRNHQLLWPPVTTSVECPDESEIVALNEYMYAVAKEPEIAVGDPPITLMRIMRRTAIVATFTIVVGGMVRFILRRLRRKP